MAGRPRKPTAAKVLDGSYRADRDGPIDGVVKGAGAPVPPADMTDAARAYWDRLCPQLVKAGVACESDSDALALLCWWLAQLAAIQQTIAALRASGAGSVGKLYIEAGIATDKVDKLAGKFGLTPSDRAKLRVEPAAAPAMPVPPRKR